MPPFVLKYMFKKYSLKGKMSDLLNKVIKTFYLDGREKQNGTGKSRCVCGWTGAAVHKPRRPRLHARFGSLPPRGWCSPWLRLAGPGWPSPLLQGPLRGRPSCQLIRASAREWGTTSAHGPLSRTCGGGVALNSRGRRRPGVLGAMCGATCLHPIPASGQPRDRLGGRTSQKGLLDPSLPFTISPYTHRLL